MKKHIHLPILALLCTVFFSSCRTVPAGRATDTPTPSPEDTAVPTAVTNPPKIRIRWLLGWTSGTDPITLFAQNSVAEDFNASQDRIELVLELNDPTGTDTDEVSQSLWSGTAADIFGPVGWPSANRFREQWLDLTPWIEAAGYDLTQFNPRLVEMYALPEGQISLPFAVFPSVTFFNRQLFDEAGLRYPPARYGEKYRMPDGSEADWSWDTLREVARLLTIDVGGRNALDAGFDTSNIRQVGFTWQYEQHPTYWGSYWAGGTLLESGGSPGNYRAQVPEAWRAAWRWTYDGIWGEKPFMGNRSMESDNGYLTDNPFDSGRVAMTVQPYWYTSCCLSDLQTWEMAALPSYNGKVGGRVDADSFRIWKGTKHPREAFEVLAYLVGEGARKLILGTKEMRPAVIALPARTADQAAWLETQKAKYPWVKNWDIVLAGLSYPDIPSAEAWMPNLWEARSRGDDFAELLRRNPGLDLDAEIEDYRSDLQTIFNQ